jgi:hypothetical protein
LIAADCTTTPARISSSPALFSRVNNSRPWALVALRSTFTAQARLSSQRRWRSSTKKLGSTVSLMKPSSQSTGLVTSAVTTRQNGE